MTQEEHYISRLHFAWPQVSCVSGFPTRGARSVFVSYKDRAGQAKTLSISETLLNLVVFFWLLSYFCFFMQLSELEFMNLGPVSSEVHTFLSLNI